MARPPSICVTSSEAGPEGDASCRSGVRKSLHGPRRLEDGVLAPAPGRVGAPSLLLYGEDEKPLLRHGGREAGRLADHGRVRPGQLRQERREPRPGYLLLAGGGHDDAPLGRVLGIGLSRGQYHRAQRTLGVVGAPPVNPPPLAQGGERGLRPFLSGGHRIRMGVEQQGRSARAEHRVHVPAGAPWLPAQAREHLLQMGGDRRLVAALGADGHELAEKLERGKGQGTGSWTRST